MEGNNNIPKSTIDKLIEKTQSKQKSKDLVKEKRKEWLEMIRKLTANGDFVFFLQIMAEYADVNKVDEDYNPANMFKDKVKQEFYKKYVRPYLTNDIINKIEVYNND